MEYLQKECNTYRLFSKAIPLVLTMATFMLAFLPLSPQLFAQTGTIQIGSGTNTTNGGGLTIPVTWYDYSYSQQIVTAAEYSAGGGVTGNITKIRWRFNTIGTTSVYGDWDVYIGHTTKTAFTSNTDWVPQADLTQVYSSENDGSIHTLTPPPTNGQWFEITFSTPFNYNGTDNIVIAVNEKTPNYDETPSFYTYTSTPNSGIVVRRDLSGFGGGPPYDLSSALPTASGTTDILPQLQFEGTLPLCSGIPIVGTITLTKQTANAGELYDVTVTGAEIKAGLTFQWQKYNETLADWEDYGATSSSAQNLIGEVAPTNVGTKVKYRLKATCSDGSQPGYSTNEEEFETVKVYCTPSFSGTSTYIKSVVTTGGVGGNNINNGTDAQSTNGYGDFTAQSVTVVQGGSFNITTHAKDASDGGWGIWIDWNENGTFEASERVPGLPTGYKDSLSNRPINVSSTQGVGLYRMRVLLNYTSSNPQNPCVSGSSGEVEDYTINVVAPAPCGGTPNAGTIALSTLTANPGELYDVTITGADNLAGLTFQWLKYNNTLSDWEEYGTASSVVQNLIGEVAPSTVGDSVKYRLKVTCNDGSDPGYSDSVKFETAIVYCTPNSTENTTDYTAKFSTLNGSTNANYIGDEDSGAYVDLSGDNTQTITHTQGFPLEFTHTYVGGTNHMRIWVDWNGNGTFADDEEVFYLHSSDLEKNGSFMIPTDKQGTYRMRVRSLWRSTAPANSLGLTPCGTLNYGTTLDFTLVVEPIVPCAGQPILGVATATPSTTSVGEAYDVIVSGIPSNSDMTFQWQKYNETLAAWENYGTTSATYQKLIGEIAPAFGDSVQYRLQATCNDGSTPGYSTTAIFKSGYCIPSYTDVDDYTAAFSTSGWGEATDNVNYTANAQMGTLGYNNLSNDSIITRYPGGKIKTSHTHFGTFLAEDNSVRIWVDWNKNGVFEDDEMEVNNTVNNLIKIDSFYVPANTAPGNYRMRLRDRWFGVADACGTFNYGQAIDFTINVLCPVVDAGTFDLDPICKKDTVTLVSTITGGTWSSDATAIATIDATSGLLTGVSNGTANITYTVTNENGCTGTKTEAVIVNALPDPGTLSVATPGDDDEVCVNAQSPAIIASVTGGAWSTIGTNASAVGGVVTGNSAGTERVIYKVTEPLTGCSDTTGIDFTIKALPNVEFTLVGQVCVNGTVNAVLDSDAVTDGSWSSDNADVDATGGVVTAGNNTGSANITHVYTDANGCTGTKTVSISVVAALSAGTVTPANVEICLTSGATVQFSSNGGSGGQWLSSDEAVATINASSGLATVLAVGSTNITYKIPASGTCPEDVSAPQSLTVHALPTIVIAPFDDVCEGTTVTLTASGAGTGGTYAWSHDATITDNETTVTATTTSTTYTVTGTDANGCSNTDPAIVVGTALTEPTFDPLDDVCQGTTPVLPAASTNATPITGSWSNANTSTIGIKTVTFTPDAGQCASSVDKTFEVIAQPVVLLVKAPTSDVCEGTTVTLTASGAGTGGTYAWSHDATITDNETTVTATTTSTTYTVTGTDANGCSNTDNVDVVGTALTEPTFDPLDDVCQGATPVLPTASTNATPITGSWSNANTSTSGSKTLTFTPDAGQCASTTTKDLLVIAQPIITLVKDPTGDVCEGTTVTLTASGAGVVTWTWTGTSATTASTTVTPNTTTSYSVTGTDANGCVSDEKPVTVDVVHPFVGATITGNDTLKVGDKMLYTGTPAGGTWSSSDEDVASFVENTSELEAKKVGQVTIAYTVNNPTPCTGSVQETKTITVVAVEFSGVNDMEVVSSVNLFPNPASDEVNVEFTLQNNTDVTVQVVDINGKVIETIMVNNATTGANSTKLNTTAYANGVYSVVLRSNNFLTTQRLVIAK